MHDHVICKVFALLLLIHRYLADFHILHFFIIESKLYIVPCVWPYYASVTITKTDTNSVHLIT